MTTTTNPANGGEPNTMSPIALLIWWAILTTATTLIGKRKGRTGEGFTWGLLLGVFGLIVIICRKPTDAVQIQRAVYTQRIQEQAARIAGTGPQT
jgi:purine-cytosine permease-like protein